MRIGDFKVGNKVVILDTLNVRRFFYGEKAVGGVATITNVDIESYEETESFCLEGNKWGINFDLSDIKLETPKNAWKGPKR